eukprot:gene10110-18770_t
MDRVGFAAILIWKKPLVPMPSCGSVAGDLQSKNKSQKQSKKTSLVAEALVEEVMEKIATNEEKHQKYKVLEQPPDLMEKNTVLFTDRIEPGVSFVERRQDCDVKNAKRLLFN